ncbi:hypothetical protein M1590_04350 [Candidatus Marsarchaeota archaeon]|nr:hypothetical protein [Candidatus Marsarchaeota archaeon]
MYKPIIFTTETRGKIARAASGGRKMGWAIEQFFIPSGFDKTLAQLDDSEYNSFWQDFKKSLHYSQLGAYLSPVNDHKRA